MILWFKPCHHPTGKVGFTSICIHTLWHTTASPSEDTSQGHDVRASKPRRSGWLRWLFWLAVSVLIAGAAQLWQALSGADWVLAAWLLPLPVLAGIAFSALWGLLGSRREVAPARAGRAKANQRKFPRHPKAHLQELQRSGDYWAIMLRLPPEGGCQVAQSLRTQVFDLYRAPLLPLGGCANASCKCGYSGLKNRRRRDVLPATLERDRRAGAVIEWTGGKLPVPPEPHEINRRQGIAPLPEGLSP
ncbi:MAG: hypothetical protein ACLGHR_08230 [Gammaproteobacteria bacterium]|jgi:hypothetical protein